ncbi:MAG TPA: M23 family metallopeptidase [Candidatus Nesterenkonia stercoripullorum]|uniref:M23 family metallopeptidase n=1 Tax=Candidatus Nesterenkonia stercoripullorum TaxID=2838701 RepID=A0A9D1USI7_9MICC|nr:M23 family metallopeptidase [Candidatus Nesterenkonia stercoripullorum]
MVAATCAATAESHRGRRQGTPGTYTIRSPFPAPRPRTLALALLLALLSLITPSAASAADKPLWLSPTVDNPDVLRPFARPPAPWAAGHRGVDLEIRPAAEGAPVRAPEEGVVSFAGKVVNRPVVSVKHPEGYVSSFEPVRATLRVGDDVAAGEAIGTLATYEVRDPQLTPGGMDEPAGAGTHHCDHPCVHWGVRHHGEYINPMRLIADVEPSILLPMGEG